MTTNCTVKRVMTNSMVIIRGSLSGETTGGNDILYGGDGDDQLYGRVGDDELYGGNGNDELRGQEGADVLSGGAGIDVAIYDQGSDAGVVVRLHNALWPGVVGLKAIRLPRW